MRHTLLLLFFTFPLFLFAQDAEFIHTYEYGFGEVITDLQQTDDGGYIAVGTQGISIGYYRIMLIKTDSLGQEEWHRFYGFPYNNDARKIEITPDGDFLILANTSGDNPLATMDNTYIIKTNPQGDTLWTRVFGGETYPDVALDMEITAEGDYIIGGNLRSNHPDGESDINIIKLNPDGDIIYNKVLNLPENEAIRTMEIAQNGDIIAGGLRTTNGSVIGPDIFVVRLNSEGDTIWTFNLDWGYYEVVENLKVTLDGNILIAGNTSSFHQGVGYDVFFLTLSPQGEMLWSKLADEDIGNLTGIRDLIAVGNDEFIWTGRNIFQGLISVQLQKIDVNANAIWDRRFSQIETDFEAYTLSEKTEGGLILGGKMDFENNECSICGAIVMTNQEGLATPTIEVDKLVSNFLVFPNPNNGDFSIEIEAINNQTILVELYNSIGQKIFHQTNQLTHGKNNLNFSFTDIPRGSYFLTIKKDTGIIESQVLLIH